MSKIEEVARAMCHDDGANWAASDFNETANGDEPEDQREYWRQKAIVAVRTLRVLTAREKIPGVSAYAKVDGKCRPVALACSWMAIIDSILSEEEAKP